MTDGHGEVDGAERFVPPAMSFDRFAVQLIRSIHCSVPEGVRLGPGTTLFEELALDSFQAFEMIVVIEEMAELLLPYETVPEMYSLIDAYHFYLAAKLASGS